ncbi:MAG: DUF2064 domain-containing protein [Candidatus Binatia bacterium]
MSGTVGGAIAIFVKTPGYSAVKTRLAASVGAAVAVDWHVRAARTVAAVSRAAAAATGAVVYWAVAEADAIAAGAWDALPSLAQGDGGLGARMGRVHAELVRRHGAGILLGADAPQLAAGELSDALAWCAAAEPHQALGPAHDGGFWLYGANRATVVARWEEVAYSWPDTADRFRATFGDYGAWRVLSTLTDLDRRDDVPAMDYELGRVLAPLPEQQALRAWLASTFADEGTGRS